MNLDFTADSARSEVFVYIVPSMRLVFYALMFGSMGALGLSIWRRARLWSQGKPGGFEKDWRLWVCRVAVFALATKKFTRNRWALRCMCCWSVDSWCSQSAPPC